MLALTVITCITVPLHVDVNAISLIRGVLHKRTCGDVRPIYKVAKFDAEKIFHRKQIAQRQARSNEKHTLFQTKNAQNFILGPPHTFIAHITLYPVLGLSHWLERGVQRIMGLSHA